MYAASVWRILRWLGVQERDAKDVSQEVFLAIHRRNATYLATVEGMVTE
jgi:DNA-directed RNA polymerase specialized sigma24 family protein